MISEAQFYQIEDAKLLIGDPEVVSTISNPRLTAEQMQSLIAVACSHPKAMFDLHDLSEIDQKQMKLEIRQSVSKRAAEFLVQNEKTGLRVPRRGMEVMSLER
ncbi:MAG: hypothetical protein ACOYJB_07140 [Christensenellaceae bacterium]|jgi:hypothetical protein